MYPKGTEALLSRKLGRKELRSTPLGREIWRERRERRKGKKSLY